MRRGQTPLPIFQPSLDRGRRRRQPGDEADRHIALLLYVSQAGMDIRRCSLGGFHLLGRRAVRMAHDREHVIQGRDAALQRLLTGSSV